MNTPDDTPESGKGLNVLGFGAKGDGKTDDTKHFQSALDAAGKTGGGTTVLVPPGTYTIKGTLEIPPGVALQGSWNLPHAGKPEHGATLLATAGKNKPDAPPFITLWGNSLVKGLSVFYPEQDPDDITPYPWTIGSGGAGNFGIIDTFLINPYQAVDFGTKRAGRHYIRNLYGEPLYRGVFVDQCYDVGRIENVHFWPFWSAGHSRKERIQKFVREHGEAFVFARTDWQYVFNTFCFGYKVGYRFMESESGFPNGNFLGIGADATNISVQVDGCSQHGILITNGEFVSFVGEVPVDILIDEHNKGTLQLQNCTFWGPAARVALLEGHGTTMFNNCNFVFPDKRKSPFPALESRGGNLVVQSCNFLEEAHHITLAKGTQSAVISGNRFAGKPKIVNESDGDVQVGFNAASPPLPKT